VIGVYVGKNRGGAGSGRAPITDTDGLPRQCHFLGQKVALGVCRHLPWQLDQRPDAGVAKHGQKRRKTGGPAGRRGPATFQTRDAGSKTAQPLIRGVSFRPWEGPPGALPLPFLQSTAGQGQKVGAVSIKFWTEPAPPPPPPPPPPHFIDEFGRGRSAGSAVIAGLKMPGHDRVSYSTIRCKRQTTARWGPVSTR